MHLQPLITHMSLHHSSICDTRSCVAAHRCGEIIQVTVTGGADGDIRIRLPAQARPCPQAHSLQPGCLCLAHHAAPFLTRRLCMCCAHGCKKQGFHCGAQQSLQRSCHYPASTAGHSLLLALWGLGPFITQGLHHAKGAHEHSAGSARQPGAQLSPALDASGFQDLFAGFSSG